MKGTRFGCGLGLCGACDVLVDGRPVHSCDTPLWSVDGKEVVTVEGLGDSPLQQAMIDEHRLLEMPLRTSSLRSLGAHANIFAIESFVDELAYRAGADPVEYRLRHLTDERARDVITAAADAAGWADRGDGWGFAFARYSNHGAYCAVVAQVEAETSVRVRRLTLAVDAGAVVSPDGLRNQVEGGAIQSTSWTVKEQVRFDRSSLGAGETAQGPTAAAIANAL